MIYTQNDCECRGGWWKCEAEKSQAKSLLGIEIIVDLYEIKSKLIKPLKAGEIQDIEEVFRYHFFDNVIAQLVNKYDISSEEIKDCIRKRKLCSLK